MEETSILPVALRTLHRWLKDTLSIPTLNFPASSPTSVKAETQILTFQMETIPAGTQQKQQLLAFQNLDGVEETLIKFCGFQWRVFEGQEQGQRQRMTLMCVSRKTGSMVCKYIYELAHRFWRLWRPTVSWERLGAESEEEEQLAKAFCCENRKRLCLRWSLKAIFWGPSPCSGEAPPPCLVFILDWMRLSYTKEGSLHCFKSTGLSVNLSHKYSQRNIQYNSWPNIWAQAGVGTELITTGVSIVDGKGCFMQVTLRYTKWKEIQSAKSWGRAFQVSQASMWLNDFSPSSCLPPR